MLATSKCLEWKILISGAALQQTTLKRACEELKVQPSHDFFILKWNSNEAPYFEIFSLVLVSSVCQHAIAHFHIRNDWELEILEI